MGTTENRMEWRCIDDEHDKSTTRNNPDKVVLVANYAFPERETNLCLDSKDLRGAVERVSNWCQNLPLTLKHWVKKIDKYTIYNSCHRTRPATMIVRTNGLSLSKCLDLLWSCKGLSFVVDKVWAVFLEVT